MTGSDTLICGKAEDVALPNCDCIIMDPPDNLGLAYDGFVDKKEPSAYYRDLALLIERATKIAPVVWVSLYHEHDFEIRKRLGIKDVRQFIWAFGFGQNRESDCGSGYRPILRIGQPAAGWDAASIKVPSVRQSLGDQRAKPGGRVPLDLWEFPRVCGTFNERRAWHPTQHPIALYIRMLKLSGGLRPGFVCADLFAGTGTIFRAARQLRIKNPSLRALGVEQSAEYCKRIRDDPETDL